jgi:hypothetical protein
VKIGFSDYSIPPHCWSIFGYHCCRSVHVRVTTCNISIIRDNSTAALDYRMYAPLITTRVGVGCPCFTLVIWKADIVAFVNLTDNRHWLPTRAAKAVQLPNFVMHVLSWLCDAGVCVCSQRVLPFIAMNACVQLQHLRRACPGHAPKPHRNSCSNHCRLGRL